MRNKRLIEIKLRKAKEKTRQWALGVNIDFPIHLPEMPESEEEDEEEVEFGFSPKN